MIIIVEGIDRVGKTTLVNKLVEACNIKSFFDSYLKFTYFDWESNKRIMINGERNNVVVNTEKINSLINFFEQFSDKIGNVLLDRFHISEFVYGFSDRDYTSYEVFNTFDKRLAELNALIIYVKPKDLEWSSKQHGSNLECHNRTFDYAVDVTRCEVMECDFDSLDEVVLKVKERLANDKSL